MGFSLQWKQEMYEKRKHFLASIKIASGCMDCKLWGPDIVLSFDHVKGEKLFCIGSRWDVSLQRLEEEVKKCDVVCHNCHAKRTVGRLKEQEAKCPPFFPHPKIARLSREVIITEKIDGTNALVWVDEDHDVWAGSKNRWLSIEEDNFGFAKWANEHFRELQHLGPGIHKGEWWGEGIQRRYGLVEKHFSLFNVERWTFAERPSCVGVVPTLYRGDFDSKVIQDILGELKESGSRAAPGFMDPEGIVVWHTAAKIGFKKTIKDDEKPKSQV